MKIETRLFQGRAYYPLVFLCYLALLIGIFPDIVFFGTGFVKRDIMRFYYPGWHFAADSMRQGVFPLWNPYHSYGVPFFANVQNCVLYPLQALMYLPSFLWGFNMYILLHVAMAGFFTCLWMLDCGASREAAFLSGLAFELSGYVLSGINLTIALCAIVYFPLVLLCLRRAFRSEGFLWPAVGGVVMLFQYLAGDPAVLFSTLVVCTLAVVWKTARAWALEKRLRFKYAFDLAKTVAVFAGLGAFQVLPFAEFLSLSNRSEPSFDAVTMWSLQYNDLVSFVFPFFSDVSLYFMGYWSRQSWLENCYFGVTVFLLACVALRCRKRETVTYHGWLALWGLALALGRFFPLYHLLYDWYPFFKFIRYPVRFVYVTHFAAACLAGFGLDAVLAGRFRAERVPRWAAPAAAVIVLLTTIVIATVPLSPWISGGIYEKLRPWMQRWSHLEWSVPQIIDMAAPVLANLKRFMVLTLFMVTGLLIARSFRVRRLILAVFFCLLVFGDLVEANVVELRMPGQMIGGADTNMKRILDDKGIYRAHVFPSVAQFQFEPPDMSHPLEEMFHLLRESLSPNLLLPYRIFYYAGYDSLYLKETFELNSRAKKIQKPDGRRYLDLLNVKYSVSMRPELDPQFQRLTDGGPFYLYENKNVLERAYLVPQALTVDLDEKALNGILSKRFDPEKYIYLEEVPPVEAPSGRAPAAGDGVEITRYTLNEVDMSVRSRLDQWLFFSDSFYPGWKATVDGRPVKIYKADYAFRAVRVPAGDSIVRWKYEPVLFKIGTGISVLTAAALALYFMTRKRGVSR